MNKKRCLTAMTLAIIMAVSSVWPVRAEAETFSSEDLDDSYNDDSIDENPEDFRIESSEEIDNLSSESGSDENYSWEYDSETKSLTIIGSGEIENKPWISDWGKEVEHITIKSTGATDAGQLFYGMEKVKDIDLSEFDTSNVTNMEGMFHRCTSLTSLDLSGFDTSKVTNMKWMFYKCLSLTSLDLSSFDTSKVTNMEGMFGENFLTSLDLSSFDTSKVTNMKWMFYECHSLTSLDLSSFDTSKVTNMEGMFYQCYSLTSLDLSSFNTSNVKYMNGMFGGGNSLTSLDLSSFDTSNVTSMSVMFGSDSLTSLDLSSFDTSKVTNMNSMFGGCNSLTSLDLSSFNTSNVANMSLMFSQCYSLTSLDLSSFDTSKVTHMGWMFDECTSLTSLDLSGFDTSKVTNINNMFDGCSSLTSVDLSSFDTSNVTGMSGMFGGCNSLTSLDLSNFDTGNVIGMVRMFDECTSLTSLDLSGFDTSKVTEMDRMFRDCSSLKAIKTPYITVTETDLPFTMYDSETGTAYDSIPILTGKSLTLVRDMSIDPTLLFVERIITLNKSTLELEKGKTEILTARITPSDVTENTIMWDSSDRLVATVDSNGTVTAVAAGNAVITASTISGTISAECHVKVTDPNAADDPGDNPSEGENDHGDVLPGDVPSDGIIPEGIWVAGIEDVSYAGIPLEQNFCVYDGTTMLVEKTDYSVSYKNNKNVYQMADRNNPSAADKTKAPQVTIKMKGNYSGSQTLYFSILPQSASEASESSLAKVDMSKVKVAKIPGQTYTGSGITVTDLKDASGAAYALGITYQNKPLTLDEDYCVASIAHSTGVGTATVILKGMQASASDTGCSFTGERKVTFRITAKPITAESITINDGKDVSAAYAKGGATPSIVVRDGSQKLKAGKDYTLKFSNNDKVASAKDSKAPTVTIIGKGNYAGKRPVAYDITGRVFGEEMTILASDVTESSKAGRFSAKIQAFDGNGMLLKAGTDYEKTVRYYYDAAGTKEVLKTDTPTAGTVLYAAVTGKGAYSSDTVYAPYTILSKDHDISKAKFSIKPQTYTGSQVLITSQDQFDKAILGTDTLSLNAENGFEVVPGTYQNNVKKGTAKVTLHGTGTYGGYKTVTFKIGTRSILDWWKGLFS